MVTALSTGHCWIVNTNLGHLWSIVTALLTDTHSGIVLCDFNINILNFKLYVGCSHLRFLDLV